MKPVTDGAEAKISFSKADVDGNPTSDKPVEGETVAIRISLEDIEGVDVDSKLGDLYLKVDTGGLAGDLTFAGNKVTVVTIAEGAVPGLKAQKKVQTRTNLYSTKQ